jgi:2,3-bisphosphoglycerate-independent phosphoglycerate mutase
MARVLLIFVDGMGIGARDPFTNPLAAFQPAVLRFFSDGAGPFPKGGLCLPTDACLGMPGLPQSATGQTTLLTGVNAVARLGRHLHGYPSRELREIIRSRSLFARLKERGFTATFANTYTPDFFSQRPRRVSVTTVMSETAQVRLHTIDDLLQDRSLFMDFTNHLLALRGFDVPLRNPAEASEILVSLALEHDFCFYEYFLTDFVGHRGRFHEAVGVLQQLDSFLLEVVNRLPLREVSLVISSDHGNIEEMNHARHTRNPVATLLWGEVCRYAEKFRKGFSLLDIAPLIESTLSTGPRSSTHPVPAEEAQDH